MLKLGESMPAGHCFIQMESYHCTCALDWKLQPLLVCLMMLQYALQY